MVEAVTREARPHKILGGNLFFSFSCCSHFLSFPSLLKFKIKNSKKKKFIIKNYHLSFIHANHWLSCVYYRVVRRIEGAQVTACCVSYFRQGRFSRTIALGGGNHPASPSLVFL